MLSATSRIAKVGVELRVWALTVDWSCSIPCRGTEWSEEEHIFSQIGISDRPGEKYKPGSGQRDHFLTGVLFSAGPGICGSFHLQSLK